MNLRVHLKRIFTFLINKLFTNVLLHLVKSGSLSFFFNKYDYIVIICVCQPILCIIWLFFLYFLVLYIILNYFHWILLPLLPLFFTENYFIVKKKHQNSALLTLSFVKYFCSFFYFCFIISIRFTYLMFQLYLAIVKDLW